MSRLSSEQSDVSADSLLHDINFETDNKNIDLQYMLNR